MPPSRQIRLSVMRRTPYPPNLTNEERNAIREYYFGSLDPCRLVTHRSTLYLTLYPSKHSERRRGAFPATFVKAECGGQNINNSKLDYVYTPIRLNPRD